MHWLFLLLAFGAFALGVTVSHTAAMVGCLLLALLLALFWVRGLYQARFGAHNQDLASMIDPAELKRLRALAQQRREDSSREP
jgi:thiol:disulfide interchange protein